ncbi:KNTase domain-containing protein [Paenibacillus yonginensis]|uniref:KNTase domain-containing protein n=1 Tax=Paenibacillus yonginensis TaxID=1462996 RepID=A0A1B1MW13_9BACL|nr:kanamycin nucleotidyltransferase C-terminal domain-containing protein [Paenibacillus yonginensis]ANS73345.1 KNTase domain-containing protein [Paenibacillus yonginensis]
MLPYPAATDRTEKIKLIQEVKEKLLSRYGEQILAIGLYGSVALEQEGPYSDIELRVVTRDGIELPGFEIILPPFKLEVGMVQLEIWLERAGAVDDSWPIKAGAILNMVPLFDPQDYFRQAKSLALSISDDAIREVMREFMIWEPYETMGKIRNSRQTGSFGYLPRAAYDLTWQTAKLIGLANRHPYSTRARTFEESVTLSSKPEGYAELAKRVMDGDLSDKQQIYELCEKLWTGLNRWTEEQGIAYISRELPL